MCGKSDDPTTPAQQSRAIRILISPLAPSVSISGTFRFIFAGKFKFVHDIIYSEFDSELVELRPSY